MPARNENRSSDPDRKPRNPIDHQKVKRRREIARRGIRRIAGLVGAA